MSKYLQTKERRIELIAASAYTCRLSRDGAGVSSAQPRTDERAREVANRFVRY